MADQLVTPEELASFLQQDLDASTANLLIDLATAKVQAAAGQRLIEATSTAVIDVDICEFSPWLALPQLPVQSVASVEIDSVACTDYLVRNQQLWRLNGWNANASAPAQVTVEFTHGYPDGAQGLQLARDMTLALAAAGYGNPSLVSAEQIDDYRVSYADAEARMQVTPGMRDMLRTAYGVTAYVTGARQY